MRMDLSLLIGGGLVVFTAVLLISVIVPWATIKETPSDIFRPRTELENLGRKIYVENGCTFCHTQFIRNIDWEHGAERIARSGDYVQDRPHLLGSERTGPDLSQEGGERPDDWHLAHFINPRYTRPESIMPAFEFLGPDQIRALIAYKQALGFRDADLRVERQRYWKGQAIAAYESGPDKNVDWLHSWVPDGWKTLPNPYPTTTVGLARGKRIYESFCIGCHGAIGDGMGPAQRYLYPPPLNFTILKGRGVSGGILYYQIMNGITGTGMMYFKRELESEKIWNVGDYVAVTFIGESDAGKPPTGIPASYETSRGVK
ncbi:MAG: Cytochrome C oxidase, mono-heme subunit/FixO [Syntrophorhabdaceae bacterium PtaU1.Bin034]|nr:MAG: Cytochrome C oxidase, mono-heme subunit/FixO [Syntrophorhabdaceae bacterium PtaU1.Bin034]